MTLPWLAIVIMSNSGVGVLCDSESALVPRIHAAEFGVHVLHARCLNIRLWSCRIRPAALAIPPPHAHSKNILEVACVFRAREVQFAWNVPVHLLSGMSVTTLCILQDRVVSPDDGFQDE
jgi:hypothetical protein